MKPSDRIFVAGHAGLAGSAIVRRLRKGGFTRLIVRERQQLDLTNQAAVAQAFDWPMNHFLLEWSTSFLRRRS